MMKAKEVLDFLNSIEGDGYGGMASFEIARANVKDMIGQQPQGSAHREEIARIIDPEAMRLSHKMDRPDLALTAEMQERIRTARAKADAILSMTRPDRGGASG